jgi:hypothetical protein
LRFIFVPARIDAQWPMPAGRHHDRNLPPSTGPEVMES